MKRRKLSLFMSASLFLLCLLVAHAEAQPFVLSKVADLNTPIPGGSGNFAGFTVNAVISNGNVAFRGEGDSEQEGIYLFNGSILSKVADLNTPIPEGSGNFIFVNVPVMDDNNIFFLGHGASGQVGFYLYDGTTSVKVADLNTPIPDGSGNFTGFYHPNFRISGRNMVFRAGGSGAQFGIYLFNGTSLSKVADPNTPIPGGSGNFTNFTEDPVISGGNVAFFGEGSSGQGIYLFNGTTLSKVADQNTPIPDGSGNFTFFPTTSQISVSGSSVVFLGNGDSGQQGIYLSNGSTLTKVVDLNTPIPGGSGNFHGLGSPVIKDGYVDFIGSGDSGQGIYLLDGGTLRKVVDPNTAIPGDSGNFIGFVLPEFAGNKIAFIGVEASGRQGIYFFDGTTLDKVADFTTPIPGGSENFTFFNPPVIDGTNLAFMGGQLSPPQVGIYLATSASEWTISTIDSAGDVGPDSSIAIDSNNKVHISYVDNINADLKYATNASGSWVVSIIDGGGAVGIYSSIGIDANNNVHISYYDVTNGDLKYATNASGSWETFTIDSTGDVGKYTSIAVDSNNKIHISYCDYTKFDLKYATNVSSSWQTFTVDSTGNVGKYTSIGIDSNDNVHISYIDNTNWVLKYAANASGLWITSVVDGSMGFGISMAIDSDNKVHISYPASTSSALKYATNASDSWVVSTIDSGGIVGDYSSIAIDSYGKIHISYFDNTNADLKYATNAFGTWVTSTLDSVGIVGGFTSIAVDSNDKVHISYYDGTNGDLKYATNACTMPIITTQPQTQTIQSGQTASMSVGVSGTTPFSYQWYKGSSGDTSSPITGAIADSYTTPPLTQTTTYWVRVTNSCGSVDSNTATVAVATAGISVISPNGAETWPAASMQKIRWSYNGNPGPYVKIELLKGGVVSRTIKSFVWKGTGGTGSFNWRIPANQAPGADYRIRVTSTTYGGCTDTSDIVFTIAAPTITVASPNAGEILTAGTTKAIRWTYTGNPGSYVKIELLKGGAVDRIIRSFVWKGTGGSGSFNWRIPANQASGTDYSIRVTSTSNNSYSDTSDNNFTISK